MNVLQTRLMKSYSFFSPVYGLVAACELMTLKKEKNNDKMESLNWFH